MAAGGCVEVELGEPELLMIEAFCSCGGLVEDFAGVGRDWIFPSVLGRARVATLHETEDAAFRAYQMGHPNRPLRPWRKAVEVKATLNGLDLRRIDVARADQILENLENGWAGLDSEIKRVERKGAQGALLQSSCGGTAVIVLEKYFAECVEFGRVIEFEPDGLVP